MAKRRKRKRRSFIYNGNRCFYDKRFCHLKRRQVEVINGWLYEEYKKLYDKNGKPPKDNDEVVSAVYDKIEERGIWIPYIEVKKYYCSRKNRFSKRYNKVHAGEVCENSD